MKINKIYHNNSLEGLKLLPDQMVNTCVTSPPYWGLRDYDIDGQIGIEETPEQYINSLVDLFREVRRVLKDDGTLWINIGDCYAGAGDRRGGKGDEKGQAKKRKTPDKEIGLKPKDLVGIPWMLAFALRSDGWYLRMDNIWNKPNAMPEPVRDRPVKSHEYVFLLSKSRKYYYDFESIKELTATGDKLRNKRSVWNVNTKPFKEAHFATFPEELITPCILAGCPEGGIVLDPFMGAGTTGYVAKKLNRNYIGYELNNDYINIANNRINPI